MAANKANLPDHARRMQDLLDGVTNIANTINEAGGVASQLPFIGISNDGVWAYGLDRTEVEEGSRWAIDIRTMQHGYTAWPPANAKDRKPLGGIMVPASMPLPNVNSLPDVGQPYTIQFGVELLCMTGGDTGTVALYKNGSYGAKAMVQTLVEEIRKQAKADPGRLCPVVELAMRSYVHPEWKRTVHNPVLQIHEWIAFEDYDGIDKSNTPVPTADGGGKAEPTPSPTRRRRIAAPAPAAAKGRKAAAPAPAPTRRRPQPAA